MGIVNIDARIFEDMLSGFERFADKMESLYQLRADIDMSSWLDNKEVCQILNISSRTLQALRSNEALKYTQICHKTYYKSEDVEEFISSLSALRQKKCSINIPTV